MNLLGNNNKTLDEAFIWNEGLINWTGTGDVIVNNSGGVINTTGSTFEAKNGANNNVEFKGAQAIFQIDMGASFVISTDNTVKFEDALFDNAGNVNVADGNHALVGGSAASFGSHQIAQGSVISVNLSSTAGPSSRTISGTYIGKGFLEIVSNATYVTGPLTVENLRMGFASSLDAYCIEEVIISPGGTLDWRAGELGNQIILTVSNNATVNLGGLDDVTWNAWVDNHGKIFWNQNNDIIMLGPLSNHPGGLFDIQVDRTMKPPAGTTLLGQIANDGIIQKSAGVG